MKNLPSNEQHKTVQGGSSSKWDFQYVEHKKKESEDNISSGCCCKEDNNGYGAGNSGGYGGSSQGNRDCMFCGDIIDL